MTDDDDDLDLKKKKSKPLADKLTSEELKQLEDTLTACILRRMANESEHSTNRWLGYGCNRMRSLRAIGVGQNEGTEAQGHPCRAVAIFDKERDEDNDYKVESVLTIDVQGADSRKMPHEEGTLYAGFLGVGKIEMKPFHCGYAKESVPSIVGIRIIGHYQFLSVRDALIDLGDKLRRQRDSEE
jgi:hypothetical protein